MNVEPMQLFWLFTFFATLIFIIGFYCILVSFNLIRVLIGVEILMKAVTLLIIFAGHVSGHTGLAQTLVITLIVIEVVLMVVTGGIIIGIYRHNNFLDTRKFRNVKG